MAKDKNSFIAYCDWGEIFDDLSDEEAGKLAKHLFDYVRDKNPKSDDRMVNLMFITIKQSLKRDLVKYDKYIDKQRVNGSKGGRPNKPTKPKPLLENPNEPKKADNVNVNAIVSDSVNGNELIKEVEDFLNQDQIRFTCIRSWKEINKISVNQDQYINHCKMFVLKLNATGELDKHKSEIRRHFVNWVPKQIKTKKNDKGITVDKAKQWLSGLEG